MTSSIFIARLLGPMFAAAGLAFLFRAQAFKGILREFIASPVLIYLAGFLGLLSGLALVLTHNVWALDWRLIITLIAWVAMARGLVTMFQPQWIAAAGSKLLEQPSYLTGAAVMNLVLGLVLVYFGYLA